MEQRPDEPLYPFYIKAPAILLGLVLTVFILSALSDVFIPLAFAVLIAILLNPLYSRLASRIPKIPAILLTLLIGFIVVMTLFYFMSTQIAGFIKSLPLLQKKATTLLHEVQN